VLPHRQAGARLGDAGVRRLEVAQADRADGGEPFAEVFALFSLSTARCSLVP
jgi:hypothetical protein